MIIPILLYHSVSDDPSPWIAPFTVTPDTFGRQLELIRAAGHEPLTVSGLRTALGRQPDLPSRPVVITFDDGFADTLDVAAPLLAAHGIPATIYLTTGFLGHRSPGGDRMLSWSAAAELGALGHELGAHSVSHPQLDTIDLDSAWQEISGSRLELEQRLSSPVLSFAYPHGYSTAAVRRLVAKAGYESACSVKNALSPYDDPPYEIARLTVTSSTTDEILLDWLAGRARIAVPGDRLAAKVWRTYRRVAGRLS
jgi:peptidoglycan/xylan/chitin deacetylase (PgdA/CDA1 family)